MALPDPRTPAGAAGLAAVLADPARALVAVDFDGTIAPIVTRPEDARPVPGAAAVLAAVAGRLGTCAVVTGRPADLVVRLLGLPPTSRVLVLGLYGLQRWQAGRLAAPPPADGVRVARARLPALLAGAPEGVHVEDKVHSLVVHTRPAADPDAARDALRGPLTELATAAGLEIEPGRYVLELRPPGVTKGSALEQLARDRGARAVVFAGDDLGDLAAFDAVGRLRADGVPGVCVCSDDGVGDAPEQLRRRADLVVAGPAAVIQLLRDLAEAVGDSGG